jgi:hypothetical protein
MLLGDICHVTYGVVQMLLIMLLDVAHGPFFSFVMLKLFPYF